MTNYERLKTLSAEEMAAFIALETCRICDIVFEHFGQEPPDVVEVARVRLEWLNEEADNEQRKAD